MVTTHEATAAAPPLLTAQEQEKVREQLNRLLETHHFSHSKRYPTLLRFIVEETLAGRGDLLKERLLGVRVFDRPADYDTAADPIVRVTVAEIRKRIAQYYHDEEHDAEIRIELLPGRYAPEFRARSHKRELAGAPAALPETAEPEIVETPAPGLSPVPALSGPNPPAQSRPRVRGLMLLAVLLIGAAFIATVAIRALRPDYTEQMWAPLLSSPKPILFCVPTEVERRHNLKGEPEPAPTAEEGVSGPTFREWQALGENVVYSDMLAALRIANVLAVHHHDYQARLTTMSTLDDLREGPAVLIGGLDNKWTMRALTPLRFHFTGSDDDHYWIMDTKNPSFDGWSLDLKQKYVAVTRDYAIIARLHNEQTGQPQMIVAGIGTSGTAAGGEFISDPRRLEELAQKIGPHFSERDFEVVLSTDVVNGIAGSPKIMAVEVW